MSLTYRDTVLITAPALNNLLKTQHSVSILAVRSDDSICPRPYETAPRIPGAQETSLAKDFSAPSHPQNGSRPLPDLAELQKTVRQLGLTRECTIIVYDHDGNLQAARAWWVLRWAGFSNVFMLDGGFQAWFEQGFPVTYDRPQPPEHSDETILTGQMPVMSAESAADLARTGVLLDSRINVNYKGGVTPPGAPRRGHIPGAHNRPAPDNLAESGAFLETEALRALYAAHGVDGTQSVGVYCGAGVSAAHNVAVLMILGIEAPMYPGSWSAWISDQERPVATGNEPG